MRDARSRRPRPSPAGDNGLTRRRRYLVACESTRSPELLDELRYRCRYYDAEVVVGEVSRVPSALVRALQDAGIRAGGWRLTDDALGSLESLLEQFDADEVIVVTEPHGRSRWIDGRLVAKARVLFPVPVWHVVIDVRDEGI